MKFISEFKELRLIMKPAKVNVVNGHITREAGIVVEFKNGEYETEDKAIIKFIKAHDKYNKSVFYQKSVKEVEDDLIAKAEKVKAKRATKKQSKKSVEDKIKNAK